MLFLQSSMRSQAYVYFCRWHTANSCKNYKLRMNDESCTQYAAFYIKWKSIKRPPPGSFLTPQSNQSDKMLSLTICACLFAVGVSYPTGPPITACKTMFPLLHNTTAMATPPPFDITLSSMTYMPNQEINVALMIKAGEDTYYEGMFLQMRRTTGDKEEPIGTFMVPQAATADLQLMACDSKANSAVSQKKKEHYNNHTVTWKAPATDVGVLRIRATIVRETEEFWVEVYSTTTLSYKATGGTTTPGGTVSSAAAATGLVVSLAAIATFFSF